MAAQQLESLADDDDDDSVTMGFPSEAPKVTGPHDSDVGMKKNRSPLSFRNIRSSFGNQWRFREKPKQNETTAARRQLVDARSSIPGSKNIKFSGTFVTGGDELNESPENESGTGFSQDSGSRQRVSRGDEEGSYELDDLSAVGATNIPQWKYLGDDIYVQTDAIFEPAILDMWTSEVREQMRAFILNKSKASSSSSSRASLKGKSAQLELVMAAAPMRSGGARPTIVMSGPKTAIHEYRKFLDEMIEMELIPRELFATHVYGKDVVG